MELENRPSDPRVLRELANSEQVQDVCRKVATGIRDDARRLAPVRTGNLRSHIVIEEYTDLDTGVDGYAVGWDDKGWYGWMVEAGTEGTAARPHLVPAAIKHGARGAGGL
jgi:HK97 gp10 family phage protein